MNNVLSTDDHLEITKFKTPNFVSLTSHTGHSVYACAYDVAIYDVLTKKTDICDCWIWWYRKEKMLILHEPKILQNKIINFGKKKTPYKFITLYFN